MWPCSSAPLTLCCSRAELHMLVSFSISFVILSCGNWKSGSWSMIQVSVEQVLDRTLFWIYFLANITTNLLVRMRWNSLKVFASSDHFNLVFHANTTCKICAVCPGNYFHRLTNWVCGIWWGSLMRLWQWVRSVVLQSCFYDWQLDNDRKFPASRPLENFVYMELMIDSQCIVRARGKRDVMRDLLCCWSNETCCAIRVSPPFSHSVSRVGMK